MGGDNITKGEVVFAEEVGEVVEKDKEEAEGAAVEAARGGRHACGAEEGREEFEEGEEELVEGGPAFAVVGEEESAQAPEEGEVGEGAD